MIFKSSIQIPPGIIDPAYQLQKNMMKFVESSLEDADIVLFLVDIRDEPETYNFLHKIKRLENACLSAFE